MNNFSLFNRIFTYCIYSVVVTLNIACDSRQSGATEESVLASFSEFYLYAAEEKLLYDLSLQRLQTMQKQNSDAYRTVAYTWNTQALKECGNKQADSKDEIVLSDYDRFVQKEKGNFHVQEIDESIKPCIKIFYITNWKNINKMIDFSTRN